VIIEDNITENSGILIEGDPAANDIERNNRQIGPGGVICNNAKAKNKKNYKVEAGS
jgi:hypothetical protein